MGCDTRFTKTCQAVDANDRRMGGNIQFLDGDALFHCHELSIVTPHGPTLAMWRVDHPRLAPLSSRDRQDKPLLHRQWQIIFHIV